MVRAVRLMTLFFYTAILLACTQLPHGVAQPVATDKIQPPELINTRWQLVVIQSMDDTKYIPNNPSNYQIAFLANGELSIVADCNRGRGSWIQNRNQLEFSQLISTRAACGPDSLYDRFMNNLNNVRSFVFVNGHIFLATQADGAILEFEAIEDGV